MVRYLFYTIGDLTYQSPLVRKLPVLFELKSLRQIHTKLTKQKQNRSSVFCYKSVTILQHIQVPLLQLYRVPSPVGKDQIVSILLHISLPAD